MADFFKKVSLAIPLNVSLFTVSKTFSIYSLSSLFISSQRYIELSSIKVRRVIYRAFRFRGIYQFYGVLNIRYSWL